MRHVYEEEHCLIPMGGKLPADDQRVVPFGGAASFVHPATGYMIARALSRASPVADEIASAIQRNELSADEVARQIIQATWNDRLRRQRDFLTFGGEYLQKIDLPKMREFFDAFFKLPTKVWSDYLSFRLEDAQERLRFGLGVFWFTSNRVRFDLIRESFTSGGLTFFRSVLPIPRLKK